MRHKDVWLLGALVEAVLALWWRYSQPEASLVSTLAIGVFVLIWLVDEDI